MKKKVISVCLCIILALSVIYIAYAEDFTIHAGTMFGDTKQQVMEKETLAYQGEKDYDDDTSYLIYDGTVAAYDNCHIYYYFDKKEELLIDAEYDMGRFFDIGNDGILNRYAQLQDALTEKYGEALSEDDETTFLILGQGVYPNSNVYDYKWVSWVAPYENYNVKIDLILSSYKGDSDLFLNIDYYTFTDEELEIAKAAYAAVKEDVEKQTNDDL